MEAAEQYFTDMIIDHACYVIFDEREDLYEYFCEELEEGTDSL